jgi:hypothetical protein
MGIVAAYAVVAGFLGFIPGSIIILIPLELIMVYHLSVANRRPFALGEFSMLSGALLTVGTILQLAVGSIFVWFGPLGWLAKGAFAFIFVLGFGCLINAYYQTENRKQAGR